MKKLLISLGLILSFLAEGQAAVLFFDGFEYSPAGTGLMPWVGAGTFAGDTGNVASGVSAGRLTSTGSSSSLTSATGFNASTLYAKTRVLLHVTTNPTSTVSFAMVQNKTGAAAIASIYLDVSTGGALSLRVRNNGSGTYGSSTITVNPDTWYRLETKVLISATVGIIEWKINGTIIDTMTSQNTGSTNLDQNLLQITTGGDGTASIYGVFDDFTASNSAYPGDSRCISRQGKAGTPTYDTFTEVGGASADVNWSETPFSATNAETSSTSSAAQTMLTAPFNAVQSGHGGEIVGSTSTINACKVAAIAKVASGSSQSIRYRLAGANTDTAKTLTTSDAYYETAVFTDTLTNLNASEIGFVKGANATLLTVEDVWMMVDYTGGSIAVNPLISGGSTTDGTSFTTASFTPTANSQVFVAVMSSFSGSAVNPSLTGNSITYNLIRAASLFTIATPTMRIHLYQGTSASPTAGTLVINFGATRTGCIWQVFEMTGSSGTIVQQNQSVTDATLTTRAVTLSAFADATNNVAIGVTGVAGITAITPGSGLTEIYDGTIGTPTMVMETEWRTGEDLSIDQSFASATGIGVMAFELEMTAAALSPALISAIEEEDDDD